MISNRRTGPGSLYLEVKGQVNVCIPLSFPPIHLQMLNNILVTDVYLQGCYIYFYYC